MDSRLYMCAQCGHNQFRIYNNEYGVQHVVCTDCHQMSTNKELQNVNEISRKDNQDNDGNVEHTS
jgi:hypothetical protein